MLPPPGTIASCTPVSTTVRIALAIARTRSGSVPKSRLPISDSPDSLSSTRAKTGSLAIALVADDEPYETPDDHVLTGLGGDLVLQLADRLALVLVGVDVYLLEQDHLGVPLRELAGSNLLANLGRFV